MSPLRTAGSPANRAGSLNQLDSPATGGAAGRRLRFLLRALRRTHFLGFARLALRLLLRCQRRLGTAARVGLHESVARSARRKAGRARHVIPSLYGLGDIAAHNVAGQRRLTQGGDGANGNQAPQSEH